MENWKVRESEKLSVKSGKLVLPLKKNADLFLFYFIS